MDTPPTQTQSDAAVTTTTTTTKPATIEDQLDAVRAALAEERSARVDLANELAEVVREGLAAINAREVETGKHLRDTVPPLLEKHIVTNSRLDRIEASLAAAGFLARQDLAAAASPATSPTSETPKS